jgi:hypothetical protein
MPLWKKKIDEIQLTLNSLVSFLKDVNCLKDEIRKLDPDSVWAENGGSFDQSDCDEVMKNFRKTARSLFEINHARAFYIEYCTHGYIFNVEEVNMVFLKYLLSSQDKFSKNAAAHDFKIIFTSMHKRLMHCIMLDLSNTCQFEFIIERKEIKIRS